MNTYSHFFVAAAVAAIAGAACAQEAAFSQGHLGLPMDAIGRATGIAMQADGLLAVGPAYKADFAATGVRYTPALGEKAPHNLPLSLSLQSIRRGGTLVHEASAVAPQQRGQAVVYERGSILERYDVLAEGLEQSFVFDAPLGGDGDLVVRCGFQSELAPMLRDDGTISFLRPEVGGVRIGKVVGIDADGDRVFGTLRLAGDALELVLPDAFVDGAHFPLVLDPLIGTEFTVYSGNDVYEPDIAYDVTNARYLAVFNRRFSFTDIDVYGQRMDSTGAAVGGIIFIDTSISTVARPRVGGVNTTDRFLVAWQRSGSPFGPWDVVCRAVNASDGVMSAIVNIAATAADEFNPVVGGDAGVSDNDAVVVWETDTGMNACQVTCAAGVDPVPFGTIALSNSSFDNTPSISKATDATARHVICWSRAVLLSDSEIIAQAVTKDLALVGGELTVTNNAVGDTRPAVDGDGVNFMVAWERTESGGSTKDIVSAFLVASGSGLTLSVGATALEAGVGVDEYGPDIAYLGTRFCVTFTARTGALLDNCYAWLVNRNCTTCNARVVLDGLNGSGWNREAAPRLAGRWIHNNALDDAIIVFGEAQDAPPFNSRVIGQRIENQGPGTGTTNVGGGCGLGGNVGTSGGPFVVGNSSFALTVSGADPAAILFLSIGFPGTGLFCGSCTLTNPLAFEFKVNVAGSASSPYPVPCEPSFVGLSLETQWVSFNTAFSPCPTAPGLSASQRLRMTLGS